MVMPLGKDYREAIALLIAMIPTALMTIFLNKKYKRKMNFSEMSLLMAAGFVIGGGLAEFIKLAMASGGTWTIENIVISIFAIWSVSLLLNYFYVIRGHSKIK